MVTLPTTASRGIFGSCRTFATKSCGPGISGWRVEREDGRSYGTPSTRFSPVTRCQRPGSFTATPDGPRLAREEPDASVALVRDCGGRGGDPPRLPGEPDQAAQGTAGIRSHVVPQRDGQSGAACSAHRRVLVDARRARRDPADR